MINQDAKENTIKRLNRIEGQIKGLKKMIEQGHYCIDLIDQINAVRRALEQVALIIMKRHVESCVVDAINTEGGKNKIDELIRTIDRFIR